ncbi:MAG: peptidylprolyl isomerase [Clostridiales bacterium]|nr:peptidylprolyl isomerase [Clostridiales bacterium]
MAGKLAGLLVLTVLLCAGCGKQEGDASTRIVLTTGFEKDEIFRIDSESCKLSEMMVYLTNTQNQYEKVYGAQIWQTDFQGVTLEENVKDRVLAQAAQIKSMNLLAAEHGVSLSVEEEKAVSEAAQQYFASLNEAEKQGMQVTEETIREIYSDYALAEKVYYYIIKDINPEISDDEARTITVEHILIKTYSLNGKGERVPYTEEARKAAYKRAQEVIGRLQSGEKFDTLITEYNEDSKSQYSFGKGELDKAFEEAAFNLGTGEISGIVESKDGYHIIKCLSTFNREETDANKVKIVEQRKKEVFGQEYNDFVAGLNKSLNEELWDSVTFLRDEHIQTSDFFEVYNEVIGDRFRRETRGL